MRPKTGLFFFLVSFMLFTGCGKEQKIEANDIIGKWKVTNEKIDLKEFTNKHGQVSLFEGLRVEKHFKEGSVIEIEEDGIIKLPSIEGKYKLNYQDGNNYISLIGESSESIHPLYIRKERLQLNTYILEKTE